jgi:hypothetical protein
MLQMTHYSVNDDDDDDDDDDNNNNNNNNNTYYVIQWCGIKQYSQTENGKEARYNN